MSAAGREDRLRRGRRRQAIGRALVETLAGPPSLATMPGRAAVLLASLAVLAAGAWLMGEYLIAEGDITLEAFPLAFAIAGTFHLGAAVAAALGLTIFGAFYFFYGVALPFAVLYGLVYGVAVLAAAVALRWIGFGELARSPVRALAGWYLVVGLAFPALTTACGVPLLVAGGGAEDGADMLLLAVSNFISDSFSPISLGLALCALASAMASPAGREARPRQGLELGLWLAGCAATLIVLLVPAEPWLRNGVGDVTPAFYLLLAWAALRFPLAFAMTATAGIGVVISSCYAFGLGGTPVPATTLDAVSAYANLLALTILAQASSAMTLQRSIDNDRAVKAELDRAHLKRYFSPRIVEELLAQSESIDRTRSQRVVVMFVDIVGFTAIAEAQTPEETIGLLREFDTEMEAEIFDNNGVVDKYIGDGVMAAFGLPSVGTADDRSAMRCARGMAERTAKLAADRRARGLTPYEIGIGLHCGEAVAGNVGSERNLSFTVIGDVVNTASRLEALSRKLDAVIVASDDVIEATRQESGDSSAALLSGFRRVGETPVKGRQEEVGIWILPRGGGKG